MKSNNEKKSTKKRCTPERALYSLLTSYPKENVDYCFTDIKRVFMEWLGTTHADDTEKRESVAYSMEILEDLGAVIIGIPKSKIVALSKELEVTKKKLQ